MVCGKREGRWSLRQGDHLAKTRLGYGRSRCCGNYPLVVTSLTTYVIYTFCSPTLFTILKPVIVPELDMPTTYALPFFHGLAFLVNEPSKVQVVIMVCALGESAGLYAHALSPSLLCCRCLCTNSIAIASSSCPSADCMYLQNLCENTHCLGPSFVYWCLVRFSPFTTCVTFALFIAFRYPEQFLPTTRSASIKLNELFPVIPNAVQSSIHA